MHDTQTSKNTKIIEFCRTSMFYCFLLYLFTFSMSIALRDVFPIICCVLLVIYYFFNAKNCELRHFDGKKYFFCLYVFLISGIIFSSNIMQSFKTVALHSFTSLALPLIALECVRTRENFFTIVRVLVAALIFQGFNGIYQYFTGYDFINHTAINSGRLTGSFSDYRVGNYVALTIIPASSIFFFLREKFANKALPITLALLAPGLFLFFFSYTRNAYVTLLAATFCYFLIIGILSWKFLLKSFVILGICALALTQISGIRLGLDTIAKDGRWQLWQHALEIFEKFPILGAGIGQYNPMLHSLNLTDNATILKLSHPHNIYLQFLSETGIFGAIFVLTFLFGMLYWGYKKLLLLKPFLLTQGQKFYWQALCFSWCGFGAFLASGLAGHNFFQRWWLALVMSYLGVFISLIVNAEKQKNGKHN